MWRLLLLGAFLRELRAGSISGSVANKFPFSLEAAKGEPVPGEGSGGSIAVLMKPMPEATTMKTWSFLKESMLKIGDQVREIMAVRKDMAMLQQDLTNQERLWHNAEIDLKQENGKLRAELERLQSEVKSGAKVRFELTKAEQALSEEQRHGQDLINQAELQAKEQQLQLDFLTNRKHNLTDFQKKVNETASKEISRAENVHLELHKDAASLNSAIDSFKDRLLHGKKEMAFEQTKFQTEITELARQLVAMNEGMKRIQGKLKPREIFERAEAAFKENLRQETQVILALQVEYQQIVADCMKMMQEQEQIKCAEGAKLESRVQEKTSFCNAVMVQNQVLKQDMAQCNLFFNIRPGESPAPPLPPPPGLAPPVLIKDFEPMQASPPSPAMFR